MNYGQFSDKRYLGPLLYHSLGLPLLSTVQGEPIELQHIHHIKTRMKYEHKEINFDSYFDTYYVKK